MSMIPGEFWDPCTWWKGWNKKSLRVAMLFDVSHDCTRVTANAEVTNSFRLADNPFSSPSATWRLRRTSRRTTGIGRSAVDERTTRHAGYQVSQKKRKRIEEVFGWMKSIGLLRKVRHRGLECVGWIFSFAAAAYNLVRIRNLTYSAPQRQCA
jgi:hypothetical protein